MIQRAITSKHARMLRSTVYARGKHSTRADVRSYAIHR
jgi:hypothetical protein